MKYFALLLLFVLVGCAGFPITPDEQIQRVTSIGGNVLAGNTSAAIGQTIDLVLILAGLKGAQVGGKKVVEKIRNGGTTPA